MFFCSECKYFAGYVGSDRGDCVRHAPVLLPGDVKGYGTQEGFIDALTNRTVFPVVFNVGFCGDFENKTAE